MEKKPVLYYPYLRIGGVSVASLQPSPARDLKKPVQSEKDLSHFASAFLADRGCFSAEKVHKAHKHTAA